MKNNIKEREKMNIVILSLISLPLYLSGVFLIQLYDYWEKRQCKR